jgi:hypothetical protein
VSATLVASDLAASYGVSTCPSPTDASMSGGPLQVGAPDDSRVHIWLDEQGGLQAERQVPWTQMNPVLHAGSQLAPLEEQSLVATSAPSSRGM